MLANVGTPDRIVRLVMGAALVIAPFILSSPLSAADWASWISIVLGVILVATALVGFCPIYAALRLSTNKHS